MANVVVPSGLRNTQQRGSQARELFAGSPGVAHAAGREGVGCGGVAFDRPERSGHAERRALDIAALEASLLRQLSLDLKAMVDFRSCPRCLRPLSRSRR